MKILFAFLFLIPTVAVFGQNPPCDINLGPDITVCNNATFPLNQHPDLPNATYTWNGNAGLSCTNCPTPIVSGLTTGIYTYIATATTTGCTTSDTIKVMVINGQAPQYIIPDDVTICKAQNVNIGGPAQPGTFYQWSSNPLFLSSNQPNPTVLVVETTTFYLAAVNITCPIPTLDSVTFTLSPPPVISVIADTAICLGESVVLGNTTPEAGVTYSWTPNNGSLDNPNAANPVATPTQTTTYQFKADNGGCSETATVTVTIDPIDIQLNVGDTVHLCQGEALDIRVLSVKPAGSPVSWKTDPSLQVSADGFSATATPTSSTTYTVSVNSPDCALSKTIYVAVDSLPDDLGIRPADTTICQGSQVILRSPTFEPAAYPDITFKWLQTEGALSPDSLYNLVIQPNVTTVYQRVTTFGACVDTSSATVTVIPSSQILVTPADTIICPGEKIQFNLTYTPGVTNIKWEPTTGLSCDQCDNPIAMVNATTTYKISGDFQGCPVGATATINIRPLPGIQFPADLQLCAGESITLNLVNDPGSNYTWTSTDPNFGTVTLGQPVVVPPLGATTYFVSAFNGCPNQGQVTVTVVGATLEAGGDATICKNATTQLTASGSLPGTYKWSDGQSGQVINVMPAQTTVYTVTYTFGDNCVLTDQVTVQVSGEAPTIDFPDDTGICPGESLLLNESPAPAGAVYSWSSAPPGFSSQAPAPQVSPAQTTIYTVTATLGNCSTTTKVTVTVFTATLSVNADTVLCAGEPVTLTAVGSATGTYAWLPGGEEEPSFTDTPTATTNYQLTYTYGENCVLTESVQVTVVPNFMVSIATDPDTNRIDVGTPIELTGVIVPNQNLSNFKFNWFDNEDVGVGNTQLINVTPSVINSDSTVDIFYRVVVISPQGCRQEAVVNLTILLPRVVVPNAFTPNGDDDNNTFGVKVLEGKIAIDHIEIYNRWGGKVFESLEPQARWDGRVNGKDAPSDVYVYRIFWRRGDGALQPPLEGHVTLLR